MKVLFLFLMTIYSSAKNDYMQNYPYIRLKCNYIGYVGVFAFPLYYFVWKFLFEQPYENLALRIVGVILCFIILIENYLPECTKKIYASIYLYFNNIQFTFFLLIHDALQ
jgi:hypothetical protein